MITFVCYPTKTARPPTKTAPPPIKTACPPTFTVIPREVVTNQFFVRFFANIFSLVYRMVTIVLLKKRTRLSGPFRYLEHARKVHRKFSRGLWKKVSAQKIGFWASFHPEKCWDFEKMKLKIGLEYSDKTPFFGLKLFFKGL